MKNFVRVKFSETIRGATGTEKTGTLPSAGYKIK